MPHGKRTATRFNEHLASFLSHMRSGAGRFAASLLAIVAVGAVVGSIAILSVNSASNRPGAHASGTPDATALASTATPTVVATCGTATTPACPEQTGDWIPIAADTPADVLAAFKQSSLYAAVQSSNTTGKGDAQYDLSRPEMPIFVRELHVPNGLNLPDVYVIPFDLANGTIGYVATCNINSTHTAIEVAGVSGAGAPRPHGELARVSVSSAISAIHTQRNILLQAGVQPYLVYVAIDATLVETGQVTWNGGGGPTNPLWLVPGADGHDYVVGNDGKVYLPTQIPLAMASPAP
ncbi:MAG: hypothetical protein ACRDID_02000 [Ktedonobacterales bacterium]